MNSLVDTVSNMGRSKYHDYKIFLNNGMRTQGVMSPELTDINGQTTNMSPDDWDYSQYTSADDDQDSVPDADEFYAHLLGPHEGSSTNWESIGLIASYRDSRPLPQSEEPLLSPSVSADPLTNIFDFSSEEQLNDIITNLATSNDETPYDADIYPGQLDGHMQHVARIGTEVGVGRVGRASGFCAPFGLICVDPWGLPADDNFRVVLNLAVGTYHGVYAERA